MRFAARAEPAARLVLAGLLLLGAGTASATGVYKWTDREGRVHYDDRTVSAQKLTLDYLKERAIPGQPQTAPPREFVAAVGNECVAARERAQNYRDAGALYAQDPAGNVYPLSPRQAGLAIAEAERDAATYCAPHAAEALYERRSAPVVAGTSAR